MRRIMKILGIITMVALLLGSGAVTPVAATPRVVTVSINAPDGVATNSDFTTDVNISGVTNFDAASYNVSFDATVLRLDDVTSGFIGSVTIPVSALNEISTGTWRVVQNVEGYAGVSGRGYLAVLHLHVIGSEGASSTISLSNGMLENNQAEEILAAWVGDTVDVVTPVPVSIDAPDVVAPDSDFTANVNITEVVDFHACKYYVSFDASVLRLDDVTSGLIGSTTITVDIYNEISSGTWRIVQNIVGATGATGSGYLTILHFHVIGSQGDSSNIDVPNGVLLDTSNKDILSTWTGDSVDVLGVDTTPPTVSSVSPQAGATDVAVDTTVSVTFSEAMDESTITTSSFILVTDSTLVPGSVSYDSGTYTATFTPSANLAAGTTYTATLSTAITDVAGNGLPAAYSWSFTTVLPGDANGDSLINALDITKVERIVAGLDAETPGADVNQDGNINALDITALERLIPIIPLPPLP